MVGFILFVKSYLGSWRPFKKRDKRENVRLRICNGYMDFVSLITEQWKDQPFSIGNYFLYTAIFLAHWPPLQASSTALLDFAMLRYMIGSKLSRHFFIQLEIRPNPVATVRVFPRFTHVTIYTVCDFTMGGWIQLGERGNDPFLQRRSIKNNTVTNFKKA